MIGWGGLTGLAGVLAFLWLVRSWVVARSEAEAVHRRCAAILDRSADAVTILDASGIITFASPGIERVLGYTPKQLVGTSHFATKHPDDEARVRAEFAKVLDDPTYIGRAEYRARRKDGEWVTVTGSAQNWLADPAVGGVVVNARDISAQKRIEVELRDAEKQYREILDSLPFMIYSVDPRPPYPPRYVSRGHEMLGFSREEWMSPAGLWTRALHPDDRQWVLLETERAMQARTTVEYEYRVIAKNGDVRWIRDRGAFMLGDDGEPALWHGAMIDVTPRVEAERALRESEVRYRDLFEDSLAANFASTPDGRILACNRAFVDLFGFSSVEEALASSAHDLYVDHVERDTWIDRLRRDGKVELYEVSLRRKDGSEVHLLENARAFFDAQGELCEVRGHLVDITDRRRLEGQLRQAQKMEAVGRLAGGIAHDFNNLLSVIGSYATLVGGAVGENDEAKSDLSEIAMAVERGASLTRQLLTFSRSRVPQVRHIDVDEVVRNADQMVHRLLGPEIALILELNTLGAHVLMDEGQLDQILVNLLVNSADALPKGGRVVVTTSALTLSGAAAEEARLQPGDYVRIEVSDTGIGMDSATVARAMEPFFTTKELGRGTGLGLPSVYGLVTQAGGAITIRSALGTGTAVAVLIPRSSASAEMRASPSVTAPLAPPGSYRILVVDDEDGVRKALVRMLQGDGHEVVSAANGAAALAAWDAARGTLDMLITDIRMPGMSGAELLTSLRTRSPNVPAIMMSGYPEDDIQYLHESPAPLSFIPKPFTMANMLECVRSIMVRG